MASKSKKDLQTENSELNQKLNMVTNNLKKLSEEHKTLQTELIQEREKSKHVCNKCDTNSEKVRNLKKHITVKKPTIGLLKCEQSEKVFVEEWKLNAHKKKHEKYPCEKCERTFNYLDTKNKHVLISHENAKLYCHYFNNEKTCPYLDRCIFLHEDAKFCRYDAMCERDLCMFKHRRKEENNLP